MSRKKEKEKIKDLYEFFLKKFNDVLFKYYKSWSHTNM